MPRIPTTQRQQAQGSRIFARTESASALAAPGRAVSDLGRILTQQANAAKKKVKEEADDVFIHGKLSEAVGAFETIDNELRTTMGVDSVDYPTTLGRSTDAYIKGLSSDAPNAKTKNELVAKLGRLQLPQLKKAWTDRNTAFYEVNNELLEQDLSATRTIMRSDWTNWFDHYTSATSSIDNAFNNFLPPDEYKSKLFQLNQDTASDVITGWFRGQGNKLGNITNIRSGDLSFEDDNLNTLYKGMTFKNREALSNSLRKEYIEDIRAENDLDDNVNKLREKAFNNSLIQFYSFDDSVSPSAKRAMLSNLKTHPSMTPEHFVKMQDIISGRDYQTNAASLNDATHNIRAGVITTQVELFDLVGDGVSPEDVRTILSPMVQQYQDRRFSQANSVLRKKFKMPEGIIIDPNSIAREEADALASLEEYAIINPGGNLLAEADRLYKETITKRDQELLQRINTTKRSLDAKLEQQKKSPTSDRRRTIEKLQRIIKALETRIDEN